IAIITSNNEKELPDAFLRRCFFHYIRFPDRETMQCIVDVHFPDLKHELVHEALTIFYDIRQVPGLKKKPSTSELLDWIKLALVKDERHLDRFDRVFGHCFNGIEAPSDPRIELPEAWLKKLVERFLTEEEKALIEALGGWEKLMETLRQRLAEQRGRHQGGGK